MEQNINNSFSKEEITEDTYEKSSLVEYNSKKSDIILNISIGLILVLILIVSVQILLRLNCKKEVVVNEQQYENNPQEELFIPPKYYDSIHNTTYNSIPAQTTVPKTPVVSATNIYANIIDTRNAGNFLQNNSVNNTYNYNKKKKVNTTSMYAYNNNIKDIPAPSSVTMHKDITNLINSQLASNHKTLSPVQYKQEVIDILSSIDASKISNNEAKSLQTILNYIKTVEPINVKGLKPAKNFKIDYPSPDLIESNPAEYLVEHFEHTTKIYTHIILNLASVEKYMLSRL